MRNINYIPFTLLIVVFAMVGCSKMAPLNRLDDKNTTTDCFTEPHVHSSPMESSAITINNGNDENNGSGITDPDHDSDHDRDKKKPR
jgi:hypothetical protein